MAEIHEALAKIHLFRGLSDEGLRRIAEIAVEESHARNSLIFKEGDMGDKLYMILDGKVRPRVAFPLRWRPCSRRRLP